VLAGTHRRMPVRASPRLINRTYHIKNSAMQR
jgi:hypothetical protein